MTTSRKFIADRRYIHVDGSLYDVEDADKGSFMSTPSFKTTVTLGVFAAAAFAMTQPASLRAGVFVGGQGFTSLVAWSSVAKFRTLIYRMTEARAPYVIDRSGQGWSDSAMAECLRMRYHNVAAQGFATAIVKLALGTGAGYALGFPEAGLALATVGAGGDLINSLWSIHADVMLTKGKWCVLKRRPQLRIKPTPVSPARG